MATKKTTKKASAPKKATAKKAKKPAAKKSAPKRKAAPKNKRGGNRASLKTSAQKEMDQFDTYSMLANPNPANPRRPQAGPDIPQLTIGVINHDLNAQTQM